MGLENPKSDGRRYYTLESYKERYDNNKKGSSKIGGIKMNFTVNCFNCSSSLTKEDIFCPNCGEKVK